MMRQGVTRAAAWEASRLCETFPNDAHEIRRQKQSDPAGGIPAGSLEVTWEVELGRLESQRGVSLS
jgi:hypothetical protein